MSSADFDPYVPLGDGRGTVVEFDESRGLGIVRREDGGVGSARGPVRYPFHCTAIADGSRNIAVGTPVTWSVAPGRMGRWEAVGIVPV